MGSFISKLCSKVKDSVIDNEEDNLFDFEEYYKLKNNYILYARFSNIVEIFDINRLSIFELKKLKMPHNELYMFHRPNNKLSDINTNVYKYNNNIYKYSNINKIKLFKLLSSKNIQNVLLPKLIYKKFNMYLEVYDYYKDGDLFNYVTENNLTFDEKLNLIKQIIIIIKDLHNINLTHRDLKLENFVIKNVNGIVTPVLIDFDYANLSNQHLDFRGGTYMYIPPERLNIELVNFNMKSCDIWAIGVICYTILFNEALWTRPDYQNDKHFRYYYEYNLNNNNSYWNDYISNTDCIDSHYKDKFINIFNYCFNLDYHNRNDILHIFNILFY